jgi:hypothetical protein
MRTVTFRTLITMAALAGATSTAGAQARAVASACTGETVVSLIERMHGETAPPAARVGIAAVGGCANVGLEQPRFLDAAPIAPIPLAPLSDLAIGGAAPSGTAGPASTATDVNVVTNPEPSTVALCATGIAALAVVARRRRRG